MALDARALAMQYAGEARQRAGGFSFEDASLQAVVYALIYIGDQIGNGPPTVAELRQDAGVPRE